MPDQPATMTDDGVREQAIDAAMQVFERSQGRTAPGRVHVAEALDAAAAVYETAETAEVERMLDETGLAGMEPVDGGLRIRLKHAHDVAAGMVSAFDALIQQRGCENYLEWESTVTDPALEQAVKAGLPADQWPPRRRYTFTVVRADGKTPHQMREHAEREHAAAAARIDAAHDALTRIYDGDVDDFATLETTVEYVVNAYRRVASAEAQAADEIARLRAELNAVADLAYRGTGNPPDALEAIHTRARTAAQT